MSVTPFTHTKAMRFGNSFELRLISRKCTDFRGMSNVEYFGIFSTDENSGIIFVIFDHFLSHFIPECTGKCRKSRKQPSFFDIYRQMSKISKITVDFRQIPKIPVHFRKILYRENTYNFRPIFDRQKFSTFGYRELLKVENFRQTHGLTAYFKDLILKGKQVFKESKTANHSKH